MFTEISGKSGRKSLKLTIPPVFLIICKTVSSLMALVFPARNRDMVDGLIPTSSAKAEGR